MSTPKDTTAAVTVLDQLIRSGFVPETLDQTHDTLKLIGLVLGQLALLKVVTDPTSENRDIVAAAKTLATLKEDPADIADRLRKSSLADLSTTQLQRIIRQVEQGSPPGDLHTLIQRVKEEPDGNP